MAIYITGDTHGDFQRFGSKYFPQQKEMSREDYVVIAGDFGGLWDGSQKDQYWLDWLNKKPFTTLFVDGNHENFDLLNTLPEKEWNGGRVHVVREHVLHLMRGQVFNFGGCALPGFVDSKNEEKTERNAGYLVVSHSGGGMLRQGTRKGIRRTPANRGMRAHWVVKGLDISEDVCHGMCP